MTDTLLPPVDPGHSTSHPASPSTPPAGPGRRPGWGGVIAVGGASALLASLLTAGVVTQLDQPGSTTTSGPTTSSSVAPSPSSGTSRTGATSAGQPDWVAVAAAVEPSVVSVRVSGRAGSGEGSGVVLDTSGHVLTNNHVVEAATTGGRIDIVLSDGRAYPAGVVGTDPTTDLAVLKLETVPSGLEAATFGNSAAVRVGQPVMALGNPLGLSDTVTTGIVSAVNRPVTTNASEQQNPFGGNGAGAESVVTNAIQTDAAINPGNSGGALVDAQGQVVGITSSIASLGSSGGQSGNIGLGFAIPANTAKSVAAQLISSGTAQHAYLGVTLSDGSVTMDGAQRQAAVIGSVSSGTPAASAGLQARDAVIAVNGQAVDSADSLVARIREVQPGTKVTLSVVRSGQSRQVDVTLTARPTS